MDLVGGIASVTQLIAYSHVVAQRLVQLYKAAQEGPSCFRTQRSNIRFLLDLVQRICTDEAPNTNAILPLLIATVNIANSLLKLLQPKGTLYNHWLWISKGQEIESTFSALNDNTRLLQLHITERTYSIITKVQKDIKHMDWSLKHNPAHEDQSPSSSSLSTMSKRSHDSEAALVPTKLSSTMSKSSRKSKAAPVATTSSSTMSKSSQKSKAAPVATTSSSTTDGGQNIKEQGHGLKVSGNKTKLTNHGQLLVANGWGQKLPNSASAEVHSNESEVDNSLCAVANADPVPPLSWHH